MKKLLKLLVLFSFFTLSLTAQVFDGQWNCDYATYDTSPSTNAIGRNCISVSAIKENTFVALARTASANFLVAYTNADSAQGRMGVRYGTSSSKQNWTSGADQVTMVQALDVAATKDSMVFVANNDAASNILVFKVGADSVITTDYRMETGADSLWGIHVDDLGRVYVASIKTDVPSEILIFNSISADVNWGTTHQSTPIQTITMPAAGVIRGITATGDGSLVYATNYTTREIYCFAGSPALGYTRVGPQFIFNDPLTVGATTLEPAPWGITLIKDKNILAFAADVTFTTSSGYQYGKIFFANPNTFELLDTINTAQWNFDKIGAYNDRPGGNTPGTASGYASTYKVHFDEDYNIYTQSYYGWSVDKWSYTGTLPTLNITVPVELTSFAANAIGNKVELKWSTATETNNKGFEVERKVNGNSSWAKIGFKEGNGTTSEARNYSFTDDLTGFNSQSFIYRLKQVDFDGTFKYSYEINVALNNLPSQFVLSQNYPNPFNPSTKIKYGIPYESNVKVTVFNALGELVGELVNSVQQPGFHEVIFDAKNISSGLYFYNIEASAVDGSGQFKDIKKMMLVR